MVVSLIDIDVSFRDCGSFGSCRLPVNVSRPGRRETVPFCIGPWRIPDQLSCAIVGGIPGRRIVAGSQAIAATIASFAGLGQPSL